MAEQSEADRLEKEASVVAGEPQSPLIWVMSNRLDNRVVLCEMDPAHPSGTGYVAGGRPRLVAKTKLVDELLYHHLLREVDEPPDGPSKPKYEDAPVAPLRVDLPGQPTRLGRPLDPKLYPPEQIAAETASRRGSRAPKELPVPKGVVVPPADLK